ncbi:hypothetical protein OJAV_G00201450 [Oryzias javanicus]|uniref:Uncharacterized protein n=1 Tax=Oryzias javanicus TaxID=123683 RepID=A0A3S2PEG5_ORYJA|nr:hypothetical protein OJAV_G00201450 [Oryzias javanicus]
MLRHQIQSHARLRDFRPSAIAPALRLLVRTEAAAGCVPCVPPISNKATKKPYECGPVKTAGQLHQQDIVF